MDQKESAVDITNTITDHSIMNDINQSTYFYDETNNNNEDNAENTPTKKKRQYTALNGDYWKPLDDGKRSRRHGSSTPTPQPTPPVQKKPRKTETPSPANNSRPAFTLRRREWVPKHEKQTTHIVEESASNPAKESPDVTNYQNPFESEPEQKMAEAPKVIPKEVSVMPVPQEIASEVKIEQPLTNNDVQKTENPTTPSLRKRKEKKPKDASKSKSGSSKKKKYDKSLRLDMALEQPNMQGWSEARIRAYAMRDKEPNAYYYRFNEIGEPQKSGAWSKEERKLFFKRMEELGGVDYRWGIFSMTIPGRVGYQCANFYRKLIASGEIKDENYKYDASQKKFRYVGKADRGGEGSTTATPTKKKQRGRKRKPREDDDESSAESSASSSEVDIMNSDESESENEDRDVLLAKAESLLHNKENSNSLNTSARSDNASDTSVGTPGQKSPRKMKQMDLGTFLDKSPSPKKEKKDTLKVPKKTKKKSPKKIAEQQKRKEEKKLAALLQKEQQMQQEALRQSLLEYKLENEGKGKEICPKLYLGSRKVAQNLEWLTENNVKYILNVTREVKNYFPDQSFEYKRVRITDAAFEDLAAHFHDTFQFISKAIEDSHSVLVHCSEGRSRSVAVIIAFMMQYHKWNLDQCYKIMCEKSDNLNINDGFKRQLMDLEQKIFNTSSVNFFDKGGRKAKISPRNSMNGVPYSSPRPSSPRLNKSTDSVSPSNSLNNSANLDISDILNTSDASVESSTPRNVPSPVLMPPPSSNMTETVSFSTSTADGARNFTMKVTDNVFTSDGKLEAQIITTETLSVTTPNDSEEVDNESEESEASSQSQSQSQSQLSDTGIVPLQPALKESGNNSLLLADLELSTSEPTEVGVQLISPPASANNTTSLTAAWDNDSASVGFDEDLLNNWLGMQ